MALDRGLHRSAGLLPSCHEVPGRDQFPAQDSTKTDAAKTGDTLRINYTGRLDDGTVFDASEGRVPLEFTLGNGEIIPGLEKCVAGMTPGETREVTIPPEEARRVRRGRIQSIPCEAIPDDIPTDPGTQLSVKTQGGQTRRRLGRVRDPCRARRQPPARGPDSDIRRHPRRVRLTGSGVPGHRPGTRPQRASSEKVKAPAAISRTRAQPSGSASKKCQAFTANFLGSKA